MNTYLITYDLNDAKNYTALYDAIEEISIDWCHPVDSTWFVITNKNAEQILDHLLKVTDEDDNLIVALMAKRDAAWFMPNDEACEWLKKNLR